MEIQDKEIIVQRINIIENMLDRLRVDILDNKLEKKKETSKYDPIEEKEITVSSEDMSECKKLLSEHSLPNGEEFTRDVVRIVKYNNISEDKLKQILTNIQKANEKEKKNDIEKYTFSCLHRVKED